MKYSLFIWFLMGAFLLIQCSDSGTDPTTINEITIGALIPLSGDYANQGNEILAALNLSVEDINASFEKNNKTTRIQLIYADTETDPATANLEMQSFISQDIRIIIGPLTSVEINGVMDAINTSDNLLISPSSTLISLAVANDNIFRIVPNDSKMVEATVEVMWNQGIRSIAILYMDDAWGQSLAGLMQETFTAKGGTYLGDVSYLGSRGSELNEKLDELSSLVDPALADTDPSSVAVQMISLDVGSFLLDLASSDTTLEKVKWFGCDGYVNTDELFLYYRAGSEFAEQIEFTSPIFGSPSTEASDAVIDRIVSQTHSTPSAYSLLTYDALTVAAKVLSAAGEEATLDELKTQLEITCASHSGITGNMSLNNAGDRENGSYFFWQIVSDGDSYKWEHTITYTDGTIE